MWTSLSMNSLGSSRSRERRSRSRPSRGSRAMMHDPSELQAAFTRGITQRLDAAVIEIAAAVEHHVDHALFLRPLGDQLAHHLRGIDIRAGLAAVAHRLLDRGGSGERAALHVVDDLR